MARADTLYANDDKGRGFFKVFFMVNDTGVRLVRSFDSAYLARGFVNKLRNSKRCTLLMTQNF